MRGANDNAGAMLRGAAVTVLLCAASLAGCSPKPTPPAVPIQQTAPVSAVASSTPATPAVSAPATQPVPTATVDCAGGAVSSTLTISAAPSKPQVGTVVRPQDTAAIKAAKKILATNEGVTLSSAKVVSMTQSKKGHWWVLFDTMDKEVGPAKAVLSFDGKKWNEQVYGLTVNDEDLPPDVRF